MYDRNGQRKYLNEAERQAFYKAVMQEPDLSKRAFCLTLFYTGCRISEALNLTWDRVDFSEKLIVFETLKQREKGIFRPIPVPSKLLGAYAKLNRNAQYLWSFSRTTGWRTIKRIMVSEKLTGIKACPKGLRHSYAVSYIKNEVPITTVQRWLGHKRLETTSLYLDVVGPEEKELAKRSWLSN